jgi:Phage integrase family.
MRVELKGIHTVRKTLANGAEVIYHYAWRGGPRLEGIPGTPAFTASFVKAQQKHRTPAEGTVFALIAEFRGSSEFTMLRDRTKHDYARYLGIIERQFATMPIEALSDPEARGVFMSWRDGLAAHPRTADLAWSVLARVLSVAKDRGRISVNPCERGGRLYTADRVDRIWTEAMIGKAIAGLPAHLRWALIMAIWTGQRQGDLLRLPWSSIEAGKIRVRQSKTGRRLLIPIGEPLRKELAQIPTVSTVILTNSYGSAWTSDGFRASWARAVQGLGIDGVTFHDLRGSSVTRLAEAGCSEPEIASITGHSLKDVSEMLDRHYLSRTNVLAENAMRRLERLDRERKL